MHAFIHEHSFSLTHHIQQSVDMSYFLFGVAPLSWIKWHEWHLKVLNLDRPCLGHTDCAWESCHLMHNTDELWALECETSQPWITGLIILHKMKAALSETSWRGMAWAGHLTRRQHCVCSHQHEMESQRKEGSVSDHTHTHTKLQSRHWSRCYDGKFNIDCQTVPRASMFRQKRKITLDIDKGGSEHEWDHQAWIVTDYSQCLNAIVMLHIITHLCYTSNVEWMNI